MDQAPPEIILSITNYLNTAELAYFSLTSKRIREHTKQHKTIDITEIINRCSRKDVVSILKILRYHPFKQLILPLNYFLNDEIEHLLVNMMQPKFTDNIIHNSNNISNWIQNKWTLGSQCQIYSNNSWHNAVIKQISNHSSYGTKLFEIQYIAENETKSIQIMSNDTASIRPLSEAMPIYKYIYDAIYPSKQKQLQLPTVKSITFQPPEGYSPYSWHYIGGSKLISSLKYLQLNHLKITSVKEIHLSILKPSQQTLVSLISSYKSIYNFFKTAKCFNSLETLCIECHTINDRFLVPVDVFSQSARAKFPRLKHLTLKKQCIKTSFSNLLSVVATLPTLVHFAVEYCKFMVSKSRIKTKHTGTKSQTVQSLHFNTITINKRRISHIADCFGGSLETIKFTQCVLPMKQQFWEYFAANCHVLRSIFCAKLCASITALLSWSNHFSHKHGAYWLKCKPTRDTNLFNMALTQAFKHKSNVNIVIEKQHSTLQQQNKVRNKVYNEQKKQHWNMPKQYEECKLCESKVGVRFMNDHLDSICVNQLIKCNLCNMDVKRIDLVTHWNNGCDEYIIQCNKCFKTFVNKNKYYEHRLWHRTQDDTLKRRYFFGNVHSIKHREEFCDDKAIELAWKCKKCQWLCMVGKSKHKCPAYCIDWGFYNLWNNCKLCDSLVPIGKMIDHLENICVNETIKCYLCNEELIRKNLVKHWKVCVGYERSNKPLSMMRFTVPSLYGKYATRYWIRNEIENKYNFYSRIPMEIFELVFAFFVETHDFTEHKVEGSTFVPYSLIECKICNPKRKGLYADIDL